MKPKSGIKFWQSLHWHWHSFPFQALILVLNSIKLVECLIETGSVHHNCGPLYRTVSEPYITDLTLGKLKSRSFLRLYWLVCGQNNISFIKGGFKPCFVLNISIINTCKFVW